MPAQAEKAERFRALHQGPAFLIPNPWDAGSARVLEALGFEALATTSGGFAFTLGRADGGVGLDEVAEHVGALDRATDLPSRSISRTASARARARGGALEAAAEAGAVGGSIEDFGHGEGIYPLELAVERVFAAAEAAAGLDFPFTLTARAENHIRGNPDLDDTIARLQAYEAAGADVLYAPGLRDGDEIRAVCAAVGKPVNVLARPGLTMEEIATAGGRRVSVGSSLAWVAAEAMVAAAERLRDGDLSALAIDGSASRLLGG